MTAARRRAALAGTVLLALAGAAAAKDLPRGAVGWPAREDAKADADPGCAGLGRDYRRAPNSDTCLRVGGSVRSEAAGVWRR